MFHAVTLHSLSTALDAGLFYQGPSNDRKGGEGRKLGGSATG